MPLHVFRFKKLMDEHQAADDIADRGSLRRVHDSSVHHACGMQTQKIVVLSEENTAICLSPSQMFRIRRAAQTGLQHREHVGPTLPQPLTTAVATCSST